MGMGYTISEHLLVERGVVQNPSFRDYKIVTAPEMPEVEMHFIESHDPEGPSGAKGVGEAPAICIPAAIRQRPRERDRSTLLRAPPDPGESASPIERPPREPMKRRTVVSMEQALSLSYATLRFVQLGWRVIRLEATPSGEALPGDPNRYIGEVVAGEDRRSYFIAPNVGKEAIALNLKEERGREVLKEILSELDVEIFCCNTLPSRYRSLGIDYGTLRAVRSDLIWAGISAMGPEYPKTPASRLPGAASLALGDIVVQPIVGEGYIYPLTTRVGGLDVKCT